jgi:hypothetical protein
MDDCPLVRLAYSRKILKQFDETGKVVIPLTAWIRFFEALAFMNLNRSKKDRHRQFLSGATVFMKKTVPFE